MFSREVAHHEIVFTGGRDEEFRAGRDCARMAIAKLGPAIETIDLEGEGSAFDHAIPDVGIGRVGEPVWPAGISGSITHANQRAIAVATRRPGIGVDLEPIMSEARAWRVRDVIASGCELAALERSAHFPMAVISTLVFSAKESVYKCLYPQVGRYFDFHDAVVTRIAEDITVCLVSDLTPTLRTGTRLRVQFSLDAAPEPSSVMTLMLL